MLEIFKQNNSFLTRAKEKSKFRYSLDFDEIGSFIDVVDSKNKPIPNIDYRVYNGIDREILQLLQSAKSEDFFNISWDEQSDNIYLHNHLKILELLRYSDKLYYKNKNIVFDEGIEKLQLKVIKKDDKFITYPTIKQKDEFKFLTSSYILIDDKI
ncbi:MAG: hypothetical protein U9R37_07730, partial [Campylobacterota bacterium]|nr:hypothetical protein [Campylobacterota bacterium]